MGGTEEWRGRRRAGRYLVESFGEGRATAFAGSVVQHKIARPSHGEEGRAMWPLENAIDPERAPEGDSYRPWGAEGERGDDRSPEVGERLFLDRDARVHDGSGLR